MRHNNQMEKEKERERAKKRFEKYVQQIKLKYNYLNVFVIEWSRAIIIIKIHRLSIGHTYIDDFLGGWCCIMEYRIHIIIQMIELTLRQ